MPPPAVSRTLISTRPPPWDEAVTPLGVRALSRTAVTLRGTRGSLRATGFAQHSRRQMSRFSLTYTLNRAFPAA